MAASQGELKPAVVIAAQPIEERSRPGPDHDFSVAQIEVG
jgi:hypothetical protein